MTATDTPPRPARDEEPARLPATVEVLPPEHPAGAIAAPATFTPERIVGLPEPGEVHTMEMVAASIAATEMVPKAYRNKPDAILACFLAGRELRIPPMQSLRDIDIVDGKPAPSAKLVRELIIRNGHTIRRVTDLNDETHAEYRYRRREWPEGEWATASFTIEMAIKAGLCRRDDDGTIRARDSKGNPKPWELYTAAMLRHRCLTTIGREDFPDCLGTMIYTAEELTDGAGVDEDGRLLPDSPARDPRSPHHVRWDLAREALEAEGDDGEAAIAWLDAQLNERAHGRAMAYIALEQQVGWADLAENVLERIRAKRRAAAAGNVDPNGPHPFTADELGACAVCGGNDGDAQHRDPDAGSGAETTPEPDAPATPDAAAPGTAAAGDETPTSPPAPAATQPPAGEPPYGTEMPPRAMVVTFHKLVREAAWPDAQYRGWLRAGWQVSSSKDLNAAEMAEAIDELREAVKPPPQGPAPSTPPSSPPRSDPPAAEETTAPPPPRDTASERVSPGHDAADVVEELQARYAEALNAAAGKPVTLARIDAKRILLLPDGDLQGADRDTLLQLVAHAEELAGIAGDASRPGTGIEIPF